MPTDESDCVHIQVDGRPIGRSACAHTFRVIYRDYSDDCIAKTAEKHG